MSNSKKKYKILIEYLPNYKVKYCFFNEPIKEDEGGGWYSIKGYNLRCAASRYKPHQTLEGVCNVEELPKEYRALFDDEQRRYESNRVHLQKMQSFTQLLKNKGNEVTSDTNPLQ